MGAPRSERVVMKSLLRMLTPRPEWMDQATCAGLPSNLFHPTAGDNGMAQRAKAICNTCPVRAECLRYAIDEREKHGIWGGKNVAERARIRRRLIATGEINIPAGRTHGL